jgi:hypothetical protein
MAELVVMKTRVAAAFGFLLAITLPLHGNGGGYVRGGIENTGDVAGFEPKATENIRILDEKLTIGLGPTEADVEVRYLMRNVTGKKVKVSFGFPVEESFDDETMGYETGAKPKARDGKKLAYCRNYQITAAGKPVKAAWQGETRELRGPQFKGVAGWLISEVTFAANEEKPVMIRFQSVYPMDVWSVSENGTRSAGIFRYRLSTAACWNGTIGTGRIVLKPQGIDPSWLRVLKPVNRFRKEGGNLVWDFENLEPTLADDLVIEARPKTDFHWAGSQAKEQTHAEYIERRSQWTMAHTNYQVKASSTLPPEGNINYHPENIRLPWSEMWCEGVEGPGVGEWLELVPEVAKPLVAISIKPGCFKNDALFAANARPKKMRVELNGEAAFTVDIPDTKDEFEFPVANYKKPVKKIRLTFQEVWSGNRFEDLCVTSVRLHVRLDKKPKLDPVR